MATPTIRIGDRVQREGDNKVGTVIEIWKQRKGISQRWAKIAYGNNPEKPDYCWNAPTDSLVIVHAGLEIPE